jgi:hypothetical protein
MFGHCDEESSIEITKKLGRHIRKVKMMPEEI